MIRRKNQVSIGLLIPLLVFPLCQLLCRRQVQQVTCQQQQQQTKGPFPGVSKDLGSFCAARPSLPIDLATMIVHVKRNVSFNYKLYLFSSDHVFQTGQVIPRDDFRVHSFPVKAKRFHEFWPLNSTTTNSLDLKEFFRLVPLDEPRGRLQRRVAPDDASGEPLPGDPKHHHRDEPFISHEPQPAGATTRRRQAANNRDNNNNNRENLNKFIEFDRDDQVSRLNLDLPDITSSSSSSSSSSANTQRESRQSFEQLVLPVGSFSSFHVNLTYLVRKDFDQIEPQLLKVLVDANKFQVTQWEVIGTQWDHRPGAGAASGLATGDFAFLSHKMLRDPGTRITSINQIYEDWITRNFYTIVYVQRRVLSDEHDEDSREDTMLAVEEHEHQTSATKATTIINERLIFRGSSTALLGADQLDYQVKAAAFITEKNGLHYYLEFLNTGKFYLCAVDWQKRPFKLIDWQQFPIKATRTQFDNEELLLCPPAVCYSRQPIDEIVAYGRLDLAEQIQRQITGRLSSGGDRHAAGTGKGDFKIQNRKHTQLVDETSTPINLSSVDSSSRLGRSAADGTSATSATNITQEPISANLSEIIEAVRISATKGGGSSSSSAGEQQTQVKLHLRDWVWTLGVSAGNPKSSAVSDNSGRQVFKWRYELAKRNDIKAKQDAYGYTLAGHEIDASYRIYNELYLISANYLIAINYTLANETVIGSIPVGEEFPGLTSNLIDPITGAFYDRYTNRLYFFKGDRYIGFDQATKKPLENFILKPSYLHAALWGGSPESASSGAGAEGGAATGPRLLSSQPVVELLGRQHQVDAIYHDLATDLVYIFTGMKFYTYYASEFKDGAFKGTSGELPQMYCINERFLDGCSFDKAYPSPCESDVEPAGRDTPHQSNGKLQQPARGEQADAADDADLVGSLRDFNREQQQKLRSIASKAGLLNVLVENSLIGKGIRTLDPLLDGADGVTRDPGRRSDQDRLVIYLLMAIVVVTILVTIVMILVLVSSTSRKSKTSRAQQAVLDQLNSSQLPRNQGSDKIVNASLATVKRSSNHNYPNSQNHTRIRPYHVPKTMLPTTNNRQATSPVGTVSIMTMNSKSRRHRNNVDIVDNSVL